ncbi:hypothetical protein H2201_001370 [Coniosporium apollinis]|uniref:Uncharacterized protein n=1 Tax=Coniosporium apollinis TaxID=61459 RepID=A0ABQ9P1T4_9PEZI|nr:hypothetical protein H2201_001370 [Coniosporium apollinis]
MDMASSDALLFLQALPKDSRLQIKTLIIPSNLIAGIKFNNQSHADKLGAFLIHSMRLENITLAVPNPPSASTTGVFDGEFRWSTWTLHRALVSAFKEGHFRAITVARPESSAERRDVHYFCQVRQHVEERLLEDYKEQLREQRRAYWDVAYEDAVHHTVASDSRNALDEFVRDTWGRAGYAVEGDSGVRLGDIGTVFTVRRIL